MTTSVEAAETGPRAMVVALLCAVCLYDGTNYEPEPAVTVIEGYAVCDDHLSLVAQQAETFASIVRARRR